MADTVYTNERPGIYPVARNGAGQDVHQTPEALHPGFITGDSDAAKYARQVFTSESQFLADANGLYIRRDNRLNDRLRQRQPGGLDNAKRDMLALAKSHEDKLKEAANFKADTAMTTLVVGTFQSMKPEERAVAVAKLIDEGDGPTLAILASVSSVYTGLGDEVKSTIADRLYSKADPRGFAAWNEAKANVKAIDRAMNVIVADLAKFGTPTDVPAEAPEAQSVAAGFAA